MQVLSLEVAVKAGVCAPPASRFRAIHIHYGALHLTRMDSTSCVGMHRFEFLLCPPVCAGCLAG